MNRWKKVFVNGWFESNGHTVDAPLTDVQITEFVGELQEQISQTSWSINK